MRVLRRLTLGLRRVPGGVILGDAVRRTFGHQDRIVEIDDFDGDLRLSLNLGEHMQGQIFWHGTYSRNIIFLLDRLLKPGMTLIDAGANIGEISLVAAKRVGAAGQVFAFEPIERFAGQLERSIAANGLTNLILRREGLADVAGEATIYVPAGRFGDGTKHDGLGTLFRMEDRSSAEATISITTLDAFIESEGIAKVDMIKLDVEGSELNALKGGSQVLRTHKPMLIVEVAQITCRAAGYEMEDLVSFLRGFGYSMHRIGRRGSLAPIEQVGLSEFQNLFCVQEA